MKCICGYIQPETVVTQKEVYYQSGKRKGELKGIHEETIEPKTEDLFIELEVEKGFGFRKLEKSYWGNGREANHCSLYACPKCGTVKLFGINDET